MEETILDFRPCLAKPADMIRAQEALRAQFSGAIAAERDRLDAGRTRPVPMPALTTRRPEARTPSLAKALREAKKAGVPVASATLTADGGVSLSFGETAKSNGSDLDQWLAGRRQ